MRKSLALVASAPVSHAEVAQGGSFGSSVPGGTHQPKRSFVVIDGFPLVAEIVIHLPERIQRTRFRKRIAGVLRHRQSLNRELESLIPITRFGVQNCDRGQGPRFRGAVLTGAPI